MSSLNSNTIAFALLGSIFSIITGPFIVIITMQLIVQEYPVSSSLYVTVGLPLVFFVTIWFMMYVLRESLKYLYRHTRKKRYDKYLVWNNIKIEHLLLPTGVYCLLAIFIRDIHGKYIFEIDFFKYFFLTMWLSMTFFRQCFEYLKRRFGRKGEGLVLNDVKIEHFLLPGAVWCAITILIKNIYQEPVIVIDALEKTAVVCGVILFLFFLILMVAEEYFGE